MAFEKFQGRQNNNQQGRQNNNQESPQQDDNKEEYDVRELFLSEIEVEGLWYSLRVYQSIGLTSGTINWPQMTLSVKFGWKWAVLTKYSEDMNPETIWGAFIDCGDLAEARRNQAEPWTVLDETGQPIGLRPNKVQKQPSGNSKAAQREATLARSAKMKAARQALGDKPFPTFPKTEETTVPAEIPDLKPSVAKPIRRNQR